MPKEPQKGKTYYFFLLNVDVDMLHIAINVNNVVDAVDAALFKAAFFTSPYVTGSICRDFSMILKINHAAIFPSKN